MRLKYAASITLAALLTVAGCANPPGEKFQITETGTVTRVTKTAKGCELRLFPATKGAEPYLREANEPAVCLEGRKGRHYQVDSRNRISVSYRVSYRTVGKGKSPLVQDDGTDNNACKLKLEWTDASGVQHGEWSLANKTQCDGYVYGGVITQTQWTPFVSMNKSKKTS
jgi:hypothetical protein